MRTAVFLEEFQQTYQEWQDLLAQVPPQRMTEPGAAGVWTVKDVIAHVTWGEREMVGVLKERALAGSDLWGVSQQERNQAVYEQNRHRSLADVQQEARQVHAELWALCQALSEGELDDPSLFKDMPLDTRPWEYIVGNTYVHYREHMPSIRQFLNLD